MKSGFCQWAPTDLCGHWRSYKSIEAPKETEYFLIVGHTSRHHLLLSSPPLITSWAALFLHRLSIFSLAFVFSSPPPRSIPLITFYLPFPTHHVHLPPPGFLLSGLNHISSKVLIRGDHFLCRCRPLLNQSACSKSISTTIYYAFSSQSRIHLCVFL